MSSNGTSVAIPASKKNPVTPEVPSVDIDRVAVEKIRVPLRGTAPLITHRFSEKAKRQMLDAMQGRKSPKEAKDPRAEFEAAAYRFADGGYGMPIIAFKAATVGGARFYSGVTMTALKQFLFFRGEVGLDGQMLARIEIDGEPIMREDVVRVGRGGTDLRYRPEFRNWRTTVDVIYVPSVITYQSVLSLIEAGGLGVGVGEWRPEKDGDFGTYEIDPEREIQFLSS